MDNLRRITRGDALIALACIAGYASLLALISDRVTLMEGDLYRMLFGILNGEVSGLRVLDPMHYGTSFSFGYLAFIYRFAGDYALHNPQALIAFINVLGYVSAILTLCLMWLALSAAYGSLVATVTLLLFSFSPLFITLGASGHPVLPAYLFLMAAAALVFRARGGWQGMLCHALAAMMLIIGMSMRADILLALPWIALTHRAAESWRDYFGKTVKRSLYLLGCFLLFLLVRHMALGEPVQTGPVVAHPQTFLDYMRQFFLLSNLVGAGLGAVLGCGAVIMLALFAAAIAVLRHGREQVRSYSFLLLPGPLMVMALALVFWLPIGVNARHFITFLFGASLFIALVMTTRLHWERNRVLTISLLLVAANLAMSGVLRPVVLHFYHSAYLTIPDERRTLTMTTLGFPWDHVRALQARHKVYEDWTKTLSQVCENEVVLMMDYDNAEQTMSSLYGSAPEPKVSLLDIEGFKRIVVITKGSRNFAFVNKADVWPADPLARILSEPQLARYKILIDPYSLSVNDHAALPPGRAAHTGCGT